MIASFMCVIHVQGVGPSVRHGLSRRRLTAAPARSSQARKKTSSALARDAPRDERRARAYILAMAEAFNDLALPDAKAARYAAVAQEIAAVLDGEPNLTARMATVASMLAASFEAYFWTGFYVVDPDKPDELVVGPYQGTLGCLRIAFGRGVCGTAAATRTTQVVEDVAAFPGHIACDSRSASEIVVPVLDRAGALIAVFDVDSDRPAAFDALDAEWLERILEQAFG
jgi:GAF domain-containing protein